MPDPTGLLLDQMIAEMRALRGRVAALEGSEYVARAGRAQALDSWFPEALLHLPFDGDRPYETMSALVNLYGHQLQRPVVATGGILGRPGRFGKAVQRAEATTNLCTNPVMGALWGAYGTPVVRELSSAWAKFGSNSLHVQGDSSGDGAASYVGTLTAGVTYTLSCWAKVISGSAGISVLRAGSPYTNYGSLSLGSGPDETWRTLTFTMPSTEPCNLVFFVGSGEGYLDGVQLEQSAYPTPLCAGDLGPGHAWTGTAHASTSTRAASRLAYPAQGHLSAAAGTVSLWAYMLAGTGTTMWLFGDYNSAQRIYLSWIPTLNGYNFQVNVSHPFASAYGANPYRRWLHLVMTWTDGVLSGYEDGALIGTGVASATTIDPTSTIDLGNNVSAATGQMNGYLDDVLVLDRALTATEVKRLYEAGVAGYPVVIHNTVPGDWKPMARAETAAGQTVNNTSWTVVDYGTVVWDTAGGIVTGAAWSYTVRRAGPYRITACCMIVTAGAFADGELAALAVWKNGAQSDTLDYSRAVPSGATNVYLGGSVEMELAVGDTIDVRCRQDSGANRTLFADTKYTNIEIEWIG